MDARSQTSSPEQKPLLIMLQSHENKPPKVWSWVYTILSPILPYFFKRPEHSGVSKEVSFHFFVGKRRVGDIKGKWKNCSNQSWPVEKAKKLWRKEGNAISLVTAHFWEYLEGELGLFSVVKRRLVVTQYLPKVTSRSVMKMKAKLFLVMPEANLSILAVDCQTGH